MKKGIIYTLLFLLFGSVAAFIVLENKVKDDTIPPLKERSGVLANTDEFKTTRKKAVELLAAIKQNPKDAKAKMQLAALYIQEARVTGDHVYYDAAAMKLANSVLKVDSNNFEANVFKGTLYLSQHHFADGLKMAQKIQKLNPYNAFVYGMLVDANVELGNYTDAVANSDKMVSIRPDIRSYSRISYLREIYGDNTGAIDAMKLAVSAGYPGEEGTEWARVHLGQLYENLGDLQSANMQYAIALQERPDYAYAYAGLGRIARANRNYPVAIQYFEKADALVSDYSLKDQLTDLYALNGEKDKSVANAKKVIDMLSRDSQSSMKDENIGHYSDRELAYAYLKTNDFDKALEHALLEYNRRPDNIDVNETLAWVYYMKGDFKNAGRYIKVALKTNCKNPMLLCRAALVMNKNGETARAKELSKMALGNNPDINEDLKADAQKLPAVI